ncbi:rod shape-determining protein MreD [Alkaliphilus crotonatoxidans]
MKAFVISMIVLLNLILQSTLFQYFEIYGVVPNTALILVISLAVYNGKIKGAGIGFVVGLLQDIIFGRMIGLNALVYMLTGYGVGLLNKNVFKDNLLIPFSLTAVSTVFYESINLLLLFFMGYKFELLSFFKKMLMVEVLYNSIVSIFVYIYVSKLYQSKLMKKRY